MPLKQVPLEQDCRPAPLWRVVLTMGIYHLIFFLAFLLYAPLLAWRMILNPRYRGGILQRMGWVPPGPSLR